MGTVLDLAPGDPGKAAKRTRYSTDNVIMGYILYLHLPAALLNLI